ncbi:MAG: Thioredoxin, partial [uncultured Quadrisphaera sp.]
ERTRRHRRHLHRRGPGGGQARPGRLLGPVVRPVPPGEPDPRRARHRARRQHRGRQAQRRREPAGHRPLRHHVDPRAERVLGRRGREVDHRGPPEAGARQRARRLPRRL